MEIGKLLFINKNQIFDLSGGVENGKIVFGTKALGAELRAPIFTTRLFLRHFYFYIFSFFWQTGFEEMINCENANLIGLNQNKLEYYKEDKKINSNDDEGKRVCTHTT